MSDKIDGIVIPILRNLQTDVSSLKTDMSIVKESIRRIDSRIAAMDHHMAGFYIEQRWQNDEMHDLKLRLEKLETPPEKTD